MRQKIVPNDVARVKELLASANGGALAAEAGQALRSLLHIGAETVIPYLGVKEIRDVLQFAHAILLAGSHASLTDAAFVKTAGYSEYVDLVKTIAKDGRSRVRAVVADHLANFDFVPDAGVYEALVRPEVASSVPTELHDVLRGLKTEAKVNTAIRRALIHAYLN
jgi:hypothetical protein